MENSNQPAFSLRDVSELSAKRKQGENEKSDCVLVGAEGGVEVVLPGAALARRGVGKRDAWPLGA